MTFLLGSSGLVQFLIWVAALLIYGLGISSTFSRWGMNQAERTVVLLISNILILLCTLLLPSTCLAFLLGVSLTGFVLPSPYHRGRFLDGLGFWLPVGIAVLLSFQTSNPLSILAQLLLLGGFIFMRQVFALRFYHHFGQMYTFAMVLCLIGLWIDEPQKWVWLVIAAAVMGLSLLACKFSRKEKPLLLFDLDGTLIDSQPLVFETFRRVFQKLKPGYPLSQQELYSFFGPTLEESFERYFPEDEVPAVIDLYQDINLALHDEMVREMPHAQKLLRDLKNEGYTIGIVSNKRRKPVMMGIEACHLGPYIEAVFAKEDQPACKPKPDGLIYAVKAMGYPLDAVIYVGDNGTDIQAARNAAFFSTGYTLDETQFRALKQQQSCRTIRDLRQLENILKEENLWIDKSIW